MITSESPSTLPIKIPVTIPNWFKVPRDPLSWTGAISDKYMGATDVLIPETTMELKINKNL